MAGNPTADVQSTSESYRERLPHWRKVRDALEGEEQVKDRGVLYLPRPRGMKKQDYDNYLQRATFYGVADRTLRGLTGLVFRVRPTVLLPPALEPLRNRATSEGFTMMQMIREASQEVLSLGRYGMLVDMSVEPTFSGLPYVATYKAEDIFRWEEWTTGGARRLVRVVVREEPETRDDRTRTILRELFLDEDGFYRQRVFEEIEPEVDTRSAIPTRSDDPEIIAGSFQKVAEFAPTVRGRRIAFIPFWFLNVFDTRPRPTKPPMLDLVNTNLAHYRNAADYEQSLFMTSQPTPYVFGIAKEDVPKAIGAGTIWHSESREVKVGFLEFMGNGIDSIRQAMMDKEERMAAQGARLIKDVERPNVTAETTRLQTRSETSVMTASVQTIEDAVGAALRFAAEWAGESPDEVEVSMNQDFVETRLQPDELQALVVGWQAGAYSRRTLHENLQAGEIVPTDRSVEDELEMIESEGDVAPPPAGGPPPFPAEE